MNKRLNIHAHTHYGGSTSKVLSQTQNKTSQTKKEGLSYSRLSFSRFLLSSEVQLRVAEKRNILQEFVFLLRNAAGYCAQSFVVFFFKSYFRL